VKAKIGLKLVVIFLVCGQAMLFAQATPSLISIDAALSAAATDIGSRVTGKTEIAIAGIEAPLSAVSDFLSGELGKRLIADGKFNVLARGAANTGNQSQIAEAVNDKSAVSIGQTLGAKIVLIGSFSRYADFNQFRLRAIDVRTSRILTLYTARIRPNDAVLSNLMRPLDNVASLTIAENALAALNRGEDLYNEGKYDEAITELNQVIRLNSNSIDAYYIRGNSYSAKGNMDRAIADWETVLRLNPNHPRAGTYISIVRQIDSQVKAHNHLQKGITYFDNKDYDRAMIEYSEAIRLNPNLAQAYYNRGQVYFLKGDWDRAIAEYTQAIRADPDYAKAYNNRGAAYANKEDYDRAIADWEEVLRIDPNYADARNNLPRALNNRGLVYYQKGDYDRAIADWEKVLRINPNNADARNYLPIALLKHGIAYYEKGDLDQAVADFTACLRINPNNVDALNNRAGLFYNRGDYDRAISDFEAVLRIDPNHANAKRFLERARQRRGN